MIKLYNPSDKEYKALDIAAAMLEYHSPHETRYVVEDVYFDYGQNWKWTTIVAYRKDGTSWQALCPRDQDLITSCDITLFEQGVKNTIASKYNPDR